MRQRHARKRWAKNLKDKKALKGKTDTLFYVGCTFALDRTLQESPRALARLMERAGEDFGLMLEDELCCGSTAKRIGHSKLFGKLSKENEKRLLAVLENEKRADAPHLAGLGVDAVECEVESRVVVAGADLRRLRENLATHRVVQLLHSTEYILDLVKKDKLRFKHAPIMVTYHDPCHLGRHAEIFEEPRKVLSAVPGLKLIEMKNSKELSRCCGGGAGVKTAYPEVSRKAALKRVREAERTGAEVLVTACPFCVQTLRDAATASGSKIEILELAVLLDRLSEPTGTGST